MLRELSILSIGQRKIISLIAKGYKNDLSSKRVLREIDLSSSSVIEAFQVLEQKDYVEQADGFDYRVIDPLIKATLLYY